MNDIDAIRNLMNNATTPGITNDNILQVVRPSDCTSRGVDPAEFRFPALNAFRLEGVAGGLGLDLKANNLKMVANYFPIDGTKVPEIIYQYAVKIQMQMNDGSLKTEDVASQTAKEDPRITVSIPYHNRPNLLPELIPCP